MFFIIVLSNTFLLIVEVVVLQPFVCIPGVIVVDHPLDLFGVGVVVAKVTANIVGLLVSSVHEIAQEYSKGREALPNVLGIGVDEGVGANDAKLWLCENVRQRQSEGIGPCFCAAGSYQHYTSIGSQLHSCETTLHNGRAPWISFTHWVDPFWSCLRPGWGGDGRMKTFLIIIVHELIYYEIDLQSNHDYASYCFRASIKST